MTLTIEYRPRKSLRVAVVCGGNSPEAEVSRVSAKGVTRALRKTYKAVESFELGAGLTALLEAFRPDVVFPVLHGPPGEDGTFQGYLEILGYAYVGSDVPASAFAMDKIVAKRVFAGRALPLVKDCVVERRSGVSQAQAKIMKALGTRVVIKPARQGSALGVTLIDRQEELAEGLALAFEYDERLLIEQRIEGKEITVGVLDTDKGPQAFPVIEIKTPQDSWYDYEHRYTAGLSDHIVPAELSVAQTIRLQAIAVAAHEALGCRDLSRADFIVPSDSVEFLLEVNTLPGMTPTSLYPDGAAAAGINFPEMVSYLVERAAVRVRSPNLSASGPAPA
jgi:D-alanine-D-alanine ligase